MDIVCPVCLRTYKNIDPALAGNSVACECGNKFIAEDEKDRQEREKIESEKNMYSRHASDVKATRCQGNLALPKEPKEIEILYIFGYIALVPSIATFFIIFQFPNTKIQALGILCAILGFTPAMIIFSLRAILKLLFETKNK